MAKIKWGMYIVDGRGKQGGHVMSKNRSGAYVRTKVTPTNPRTSFQMAVRGLFAAISSAWASLTEAQRESFNNLVSSYARTDIFGDIKNPTGKNLFQRLNLNAQYVGVAAINVCPEPTEVPFANLDTAVADVSSGTFDVTYANDTTGSYVVVFATPPMSQGIKFIKNKLRRLEFQPGADNDTIDIQASYVAKFGQPAAGANVYVGIQVINANGQASPLETIKALVQA